jgi:pilus assembly protein CpaC
MATTGVRKGLLILLLAVAGGGTVLWAQAPALPTSAVVAAATPSEVDAGAVRLLVGRSTVLDVGTAITRVSLTSAEVADALVTSPSQLLINGKTPGAISMFVWDRVGTLKRYEVIVQRDLARLTEQVRQLFPGEKIEVSSSGKNVVLSGLVTNKDVIEKAVNVAAGFVDKREEVVPLLQLQPGAPSNQVLLRVRFAEVSRSALTELGASLFTSPLGIENTIGRVTTQQFTAPGFENLEWTKESGDFGAPVTSAKGQFTFSDFLNIFLFNQQYDIGTMVRALQSKGLFQSLAEPNLVSESGKEASFLAGGEFPIPIAQGSGANIGVSVVFKEFGIRLTFTPTVAGDRVHLKVRPEVSTLDFANSVVLSGFRIPALTTRRTETELELQNGQTFAIAGLMNNSVTSTLSKVPGIGDIPILGLLFKSKAAQKQQTELVVMITPVILPNNSSGVTPDLPRLQEPFLPPQPQSRTLPPPAPAYAAPGANADARPVTTPTAAGRQAVAPVAVAPASASSAAAAVAALTPAGPRPVETVASAPAAPAPEVTPPSPADQRAAARARRQEERQAEERAKAEARAAASARAAEGRRAAAQRAAEQKQAEREREQQEKAAREQAKRDAERSKAAQAAAKRQAERDREQQRELDKAAAELKRAEERYKAEVSKQQQP